MWWATPTAFIYTYSDPPWCKANSTPTVLPETTRQCWRHLQVERKPELCTIKRKCFGKTLLLPAKFSERLCVKSCPQWRTHSAAHSEHWYCKQTRNRMRKTRHTVTVPIYIELSANYLCPSMCTMSDFIIPWVWRAVKMKIADSALGSFGVDNPVATHLLL